MDLHAYLRAVRKGWWVIVVGVAIGAGLAALYVARSTPIYAAKVSLYLSSPTQTTSSPQGVDQALMDRAESYANLASSDRLAALIIKAEGIKATPGSVAAQITGVPRLNTTIFDVTVRDPIPARALAIAQGVGDQFPIMAAQIDPTSSKTVSIHVVSGPSVGATPVSPRKSLDLAAGGAAGLLLGLLAAVVRELLDTAIRTPEQLNELTDRPVLGQVSFDNDARKSPLFIDEMHGERRSEEFRQLRTNISFLNAADPVSVLVVTSCLDLEGKSTTAANLAVVAAETESRVLLIEADLRRPKVSSYLGLDSTSGLTNVLAGQVRVDEVLQGWGDRGLSVLASGPVPPNPSELLASKQMATLMKDLRRRFDMIIIDCPPLLPVTDAVVASRLADGVLVVVRHGKTKRDQLDRAVADLETVDTRLLGTVLNMRPVRGVDSAYLTSSYYYTDRSGPRHAESGGARPAVAPADEPDPVASSEVESPEPPDADAAASQTAVARVVEMRERESALASTWPRQRRRQRQSLDRHVREMARHTYDESGATGGRGAAGDVRADDAPSMAHEEMAANRSR